MAKLPDDSRNGLRENTWTMTGYVVAFSLPYSLPLSTFFSNDLYQIFAPLITDITKLVEAQVEAIKVKRLKENHPKGDEVKAILLVGGFGSSQYLKRCLEKKFPKIEIIQPDGAWSAIMK